MTPRRLYRFFAIAETVTWALLITGMILKYTGITEIGVRIGGGIHGFIFLCFCVSTVLIWVNNRWSFGRGIAGLASAIVPFMTIPFDRSVEKAGLLSAGWRFRADSDDPEEKPSTLPESVLALYVRQPVVAGVVSLVVVIAVFAGLLALGNPLDAIRS